MPGGKSYYLAENLLNHVLGGPDFSRPATVYVGLFTTLPTEGGVGGVEASGGGYARIAVTNNATNFPAASGNVKHNGTAISWPAFTQDMPTFVGAGIWDAASGGNLLYWGPFTTPRTVLSGETFQIPAGGGTFTEV
jgi:hypothetical protein